MSYGASSYGAVSYGGTGGPNNFQMAITEGVVASSPLAALVTAMLTEIIAVPTLLQSQWASHNALSDSAHATTALTVAFSVTITDAVTGNATLNLTYGHIAAMIDGVLASPNCQSSLQAKNAVIETLFVADRLTRDFPTSVTEAAALHDALQSTLATLVLVTEDATAISLVEASANLTILVSETAEVTDDVATMLAMNEHVTEGVIAVLSFALNGDVFTGVVLNTETAAVSEYTNFPFNSFAENFGGHDFGIADDGIYILEGPDDAGTPTDSFIRTGLMRIANGHKARIPTAYFGYSATGALVLKVITTQPDGNKTENWYQLEQRNANAPRSNRVKIGRGLASVYWGFELHSVNGSSFDLDTIQLFPMALDRRI